MPETPVRTIIVDDEPLGRDAVRLRLADDSRFEIIAECDGGAAAVRDIAALEPDLVFLDIQMPEINGFDVIEQAGSHARGFVMVTAFDAHAVRAFDHHAIDYVLKPIDPARFAVACDRAIHQMQGGAAPAVQQLLAALQDDRPRDDRILLKTVESVLFLQASELQWIESAANYVRVHALGEMYVVRNTMTQMEKMLDATIFARVHRSYLVNVSAIREVRTAAGGGDHEVRLVDGTVLPLARGQRASVMQRLGGG